MTYTYTMTITAKNQVTLPVAIVRQYNLKKGDTLIVETEENAIKIRTQKEIFHKLAGSVELPKKFQGKTIEKIIAAAKKAHYQKRVHTYNTNS